MNDLSRILVTGGAGFIGSHLVDKLVSSGLQITVLDNLSTGRLSNIVGHVREGKIAFFKGDILNADCVLRAIQGVEAVVHLAATTSVPFSVLNPDLTYEQNAKATADLLNYGTKSGVKKFVFVSSSAVYGRAKYLPIDEKHPTNPLSPYADSKLVAERHCQLFLSEHKMEIPILRLFNVYGPRQSSSENGGVVARFVANTTNKEPLIIYGDGLQSRDFVHVSDVSEVILKILLDNHMKNGIFNIGSGRSTSLNDLANKVLSFSKVCLQIKYEKERTGDVKHSSADISKARKVLGYEPKVDLETGLQTMFRGHGGE
ncbi:GDP-mannose 4,6-dehydratase [Candidatus Bathyarchaeota archaeon]|nr:GDP-mannose 4,6-dehydratase [Candidatus Bathyarchaeota archaeon]